MVDYRPAEKLLGNFLEFIKNTKLNLKYLLHVGMDEPFGKIKFYKSRKDGDEIKTIKEFLQIRTCPLHTVHNCSLSKLFCKVDPFAI